MSHPLMDTLKNKYRMTAYFYDLLDYPWEKTYRLWRGELLKDLKGDVLEAGVGTGRNIIHYPEAVHLTGIDLSPQMLNFAKRRAQKAKCTVTLKEMDVTDMSEIPDNHFDALISTFLCCVLPNELQGEALREFARVLKPGGKIILLEMVYSKDPKVASFQKRITPIVSTLYGARFDRETLSIMREIESYMDIQTRFLKDDTYLLIEARKK